MAISYFSLVLKPPTTLCHPCCQWMALPHHFNWVRSLSNPHFLLSSATKSVCFPALVSVFPAVKVEEVSLLLKTSPSTYILSSIPSHSSVNSFFRLSLFPALSDFNIFMRLWKSSGKVEKEAEFLATPLSLVSQNLHWHRIIPSYHPHSHPCWSSYTRDTGTLFFPSTTPPLAFSVSVNGIHPVAQTD